MLISSQLECFPKLIGLAWILLPFLTSSLNFLPFLFLSDIIKEHHIWKEGLNYILWKRFTFNSIKHECYDAGHNTLFRRNRHFPRSVCLSQLPYVLLSPFLFIPYPFSSLSLSPSLSLSHTHTHPPWTFMFLIGGSSSFWHSLDHPPGNRVCSSVTEPFDKCSCQPLRNPFTCDIPNELEKVHWDGFL